MSAFQIASFVATRFYLVATIQTGSTCLDSWREAQPRTNREAPPSPERGGAIPLLWRRAGERLLSGLLALFFTCTAAVAQEYKYEIGGMAGTSMYMGDVNQTDLFLGLNPGGGLVFRKNINFRWALKTGLMWGKISGDTKNTENVFFNHAEYTFSRNVFDLDGQMEFNFLPYSDKFAYLNTSRISPYLLSGLGFTMTPGKQTSFGLHFSLGFGVKYKIKNRINLGVEYAVRKLFEDGFDSPDSEGFNLDNPYKINSGLLKNKDWYNTLMFSVTWDFGPNNRECTNE